MIKTYPQAKSACLEKGISFIGRVFVLILTACIYQPALSDYSSEELLEIPSTKRPLTVADSIATTYLVDSERPNHPGTTDFKFSPSGQHFLIVSRKGDVESGLNKYELILYNVDDVLSYVNSVGIKKLPEGRTLVQLATTSDHGADRMHAIRELRWMADSETVLHIGDTGNQPGQVFSVNIDTLEHKQLTHHPRTVHFYDVDARFQSIFFVSTVENLDEDRDKTSFEVGVRNNTFVSNTRIESPYFFKHQFYYLRLNQSEVAQPVGRIFSGRSELNRNVWLAQDGKKAIAVIPYKASTPKYLSENYPPIKKSTIFERVLTSRDTNVSVERQDFFKQFIMIDTESGNVDEILAKAPTGMWIGGTVHQALWLPDGQNVILANTFLPKNVSSSEEQLKCCDQPAIVNYNIYTGRLTRIADLAVAYSENEGIQKASEVFHSMSLGSDGILTIKFRKESSDGEFLYKSYERQKGNWIETSSSSENGERQSRLRLSVRQSLNTSPEILATDTVTAHEKIITDLNPQFKQLTFGKVEVFDWLDAEGRNWRGGLVYPPGYDPNKEYPLVIQTRGFYPDRFLIDGTLPVGSFAAQALANRGLLVLQMPTLTGLVTSEEKGTPVELEAHRKGVESAIDVLVSRGLADRRRVGLMGYSRSGMYVDDMITFSDYDVAAAIVTDASTLSFVNYTQNYGRDGLGMGFHEKMFGGVMPWGDTRSFWFSRLSTFNLDRVKTPLRLEKYMDNRNYDYSYWGQYVLLRRLHKPVELLIFPKAFHVTISPSARGESAGGTVDWFTFWLMGEEDPDPAKAEQYERWRNLQEQQEKSEVEAIKARQWHKEQAVKRERYEQSLKGREAVNDGVSTKANVASN